MKKTAVLLLVVFTMASFTGVEMKKAATYKVDVKQSKIEWLGKKVTGQHNGFIQLKQGNLVMEDGKLTGGEFHVDMATLTVEDIKDPSTNQKLVGHLKSDDFFGVNNFPHSKMVIKEVSAKGGNEYEITGHLTIRDQTHPVTFPATISTDGEKVNATAEITIDRSKYNVKYGSGSFFDNLGDKMIYDDFTLTVNLVATTASM